MGKLLPYAPYGAVKSRRHRADWGTELVWAKCAPYAPCALIVYRRPEQEAVGGSVRLMRPMRLKSRDTGVQLSRKRRGGKCAPYAPYAP